MKKRLALLLIAVMAMGLVACGKAKDGKTETTGNTTVETIETTEPATETTTDAAQVSESTETNAPESVKITTLNANKEEVEITVPYNPQRIAILDLAALDIIDNLGLGDRVVGTANTSIDYLSAYVNNKEIKNLGTIKEADLEAVMECEPDVIFIGGRLSASYDALSEIAPVIYLSTNSEIGLVESVTKNATTIASLFGMESDIEKKTADFAERIAALQAVAEGKTALVGMTTSGSFNLLGNDGRCSIIGAEIGFNNLTASANGEQSGNGYNKNSEGQKPEGKKGNDNSDNSGSPHGNESSFETVVAQNPDYIFVMDRDRAIGTEGVQLAQEIMENELVMSTDAYKNGNIVYLEHPAVWYTAEGGITALDVMLQDLESALLK
jgi:iron complex transport system substrate-binding protein